MPRRPSPGPLGSSTAVEGDPRGEDVAVSWEAMSEFEGCLLTGGSSPPRSAAAGGTDHDTNASHCSL